jgi:hypothetical protein
VVGFVDRAHPTVAEEAEQAVLAAEHLAGLHHWTSGYHIETPQAAQAGERARGEGAEKAGYRQDDALR